MNITPDGYTTVAPWVTTDDSGAFLDFVTEAFHGTEIARIVTENGVVGHIETRIGDTVVLGFDRPAGWPPLPSLLRVFLPDVDEAVQRAVRVGARILTPLADDAFGQRSGRLIDPFGNIWWVVTRVEEVTENEIWRRLKDPVYAEVMRVAQETIDAELTGRRGRSSPPVRPS